MKSRTNQIQDAILANPELVQLIGYAAESGVITEEAIIIACKRIDKCNFKLLVEDVSRAFGGELEKGRMWFKGKYTDYLKLKNPKLARTIKLNLRSIFDRVSREKELAIRLMAGLMNSEAGKIGVRKKEPFVSVKLPDRRLIESASVAMDLIVSDGKEDGKSIDEDKSTLTLKEDKSVYHSPYTSAFKKTALVWLLNHVPNCNYCSELISPVLHLYKTRGKEGRRGIV